MLRSANALADRVLSLVVPKAEAMAACSGCYYVCAGACGSRKAQYRCCYKANCTDTCSRTGYCC